MRFARILNALYAEPWNITFAQWLSVHELVQSRLLQTGDNAAFKDFVNPRPDMVLDAQGIAHIHVTGVLGLHLTKLERTCGNTSYEQIAEELSLALSQGARGVLLHVNSAGGAAAGNIESASVIAACPVPCVAYAGEMMASAAYALGVGASRVFCAPSAMVGSIGTILPLIDRTGEWSLRGLKPAYVTHTGGDLKDTFHPPSFTPEHRAYLQELVDDTFMLFRDHVLAHRSVPSSAMRGQVFVGKRAKEANLVDGVTTEVQAYEALLSELS